jgi:hypothetical protein
MTRRAVKKPRFTFLDPAEGVITLGLISEPMPLSRKIAHRCNLPGIAWH